MDVTDQILELLRMRATERIARHLIELAAERPTVQNRYDGSAGYCAGAWDFDLDAAILAPIIQVAA